MLPSFLLPETTARENGFGPAMEVGNDTGVLAITLGITRIREQESLDIAIWGSADGSNWGTKPIIHFPQKFYCGTYSMELDLTEQPDVRYLRTEYKMNRWGRGEPTPLFGFYLFVEPVEKAVAAGV